MVGFGGKAIESRALKEAPRQREKPALLLIAGGTLKEEGGAKFQVLNRSRPISSKKF